jgi:hypothetical protein
MLTKEEWEAAINATNFCVACWGNTKDGMCPAGSIARVRGVRLEFGGTCRVCKKEKVNTAESDIEGLLVALDDLSQALDMTSAEFLDTLVELGKDTKELIRNGYESAYGMARAGT